MWSSSHNKNKLYCDRVDYVIKPTPNDDLVSELDVHRTVVVADKHAGECRR